MASKKVEEKRIVSHVVSLVLGIISIVTNLFWFMSLPTGITAIVLGAKSYKSAGKKVGLAGMITGIVGISLCVLIYICLTIILILQSI